MEISFMMQVFNILVLCVPHRLQEHPKKFLFEGFCFNPREHKQKWNYIISKKKTNKKHYQKFQIS